ncbi:HDOD domain-containing protein [Corallincola platygyrae]|uniref:HDOD domain-containing protein n=1 Tax=Corallincola platygyrae TaxID=1193278 RepID=A0ABW4XNF8_9GAMM
MSELKSLVVDDDFVCRSKMSAILNGIGNSTQAENGNSALSRFVAALKAEVPFQFVTLDVDMPDMRGPEVLAELRALERRYCLAEQERAKIVMVTSHSDRKEVINAIKAGCDDYLLKPFTGASIKEKLIELGLIAPSDERSEGEESDAAENLMTPEQALKISMERLKKGELELPKQSETYNQLKDLMASGADINQIAELLKTDLVVTAKLIKLSNSTYYRGLRPCKSLVDAINRLGLQVTEQQVNAICMKPQFDMLSDGARQSAEACWRDAINVAVSCEQLARVCDVNFALDPFTMGLIHNTGKMLILRLFDELSQQRPMTDEDKLQLEAAFEDYQGMFGATVLKSWGFPIGYQQLARQQQGLKYIDQGLAASPELHLLFVAKRALIAIREGVTEKGAKTLSSLPFCQQHGMSELALFEVMGKLVEVLPELRQVYCSE